MIFYNRLVTRSNSTLFKLKKCSASNMYKWCQQELYRMITYCRLVNSTRYEQITAYSKVKNTNSKYTDNNNEPCAKEYSNT